MQIKWNILSKYRNELYGFSILWIILFHGLEMKNFTLSKPLKVLEGILKHGNCGVEVFLFLSGVCLYYSLKSNENIRKFYINRLYRIFIPLIMIDGVYWFYTCILRDGNILKFIKNITFYSFWIDGNGQVWFIALIVPLYIVYPIVFKYILNNEKVNRLLYIIILCIIVYVICYIFKQANPKWFKGIEIALTRVPVFLLGCYCGILSYENREISSNIKTFSLLILILGIGYFYIHPIGLVGAFRTPYLLLGPSIAIWGALCLEVINNKTINKQLCNWGALSLELYLSHIVLRKIFTGSTLIGKSSVANFHKYLVFVLCGSYIISRIVCLINKSNK